ncbi:MAG: hypothetical protein LC656_00695 [Sphingomonadales bacterium]|nr:hypothetical protein [Sphingomonadales bacterium]
MLVLLYRWPRTGKKIRSAGFALGLALSSVFEPAKREATEMIDKQKDIGPARVDAEGPPARS